MKAKPWTVLSFALAMAIVLVGWWASGSFCAAAEPGPAAPPAEPPPVAPPAVPAPPPGAPPAVPAEGPGEKVAPAAGTAEEEVPADTLKRKKTMLDTINDGGWIGHSIIVLSFVALAFIIEHSVNVRRTKMLPEEFIHELEEYFNNEQYEEALELCNVEKNLLSDVIRAGLSRIDGGYERMQEAMAAAAEESALVLQQKISNLNLIGAVAPMLGLFGTVSGMIGAFGKIAQMSVVRPQALAGNINEALVTTFEGLLVAIPVLCVYQFFANRATRLILEAGTVVSDLMERFKPAK